jgi:hypothetical protein
MFLANIGSNKPSDE